MKVGILTFHCAHNYGAVLQAYAIQEQLKLMGFDVEIINYRPAYLLRPYGYLPQFYFRMKKNGYARCLIYNVKILFRWLGTLIPTYKRRKGFNKFIQSKLSLSSYRYDSPFVEHNEYDFYIIGSDQVWNPKITKKFDDVYFGNFKVREGGKKISYAVSMPLYTFSSQQKELLDVNLRNFSAISVRETQLEEFIFNNFNIKSQVVLDPTLLVDNFVWKKMAVIPNINKKYVLVYTLELRVEAMRIARNIASEIGAIIVELCGRSKVFDIMTSYSTASPEKFVGCFQNASFIVTSSFHGTAFAISYQKPFYSIMRGNELDSRQLSLLTDLDLHDRLVSRESNPKYSEIDYSTVIQKWRAMQNKSRNFLKQSIS